MSADRTLLLILFLFYHPNLEKWCLKHQISLFFCNKIYNIELELIQDVFSIKFKFYIFQ